MILLGVFIFANFSTRAVLQAFIVIRSALHLVSHHQVLYIADCDLDSIDGVANMENLQELYAAFNYVDDLTALCGNEELRVVDLETNAITDVAQVRARRKHFTSY